MTEKSLSENVACSMGQVTIKLIELIVQSLSQEEQVQKIKGSKPPQMPKPSVKVQLENYKGGRVDYYWDLWVEWNGRGNWRTPRRYEVYQGEASGNNDEVVGLDMDLSTYNMRGGEKVKLYVRAVAGSKTYEKTVEELFVIKGLNPTKELMLLTLSDLKYKVIAYHESRFNQFAANTTAECQAEASYPLQGGKNPDDIGIMQINNPSNDDIIWNWVENINVGKRKLDWNLWYVEKIFAEKQYNQNPDARKLTYEEKLEMAYAMYNNYGARKNYWEWKVVKKEDDKEIYNWSKNKPEENPNYAENLMKIYNNPPSGW